MATDKDSKDAPVASGTHLWLVMMKAYRAMARVAERSIGAAEIGPTDFMILEILLHKGPQPVNDIGRRIGLTSGASTTAVDRLATAELVARESHPSDRRTRVVRLTDQGKRIAARTFAVHRAAMDAAGEALSASERTTLISLLKKLGQAAER